MTEEKIKKLSVHLKVNSYDQTIFSDCNLYEAYVRTTLFNELYEQMKHITDLPVTKWETFNTQTWENEHHLDIYIVSEDILKEYYEMKEEKLLQ